jgi:uncharacterized protein YyaL (SSP411 family)
MLNNIYRISKLTGDYKIRKHAEKQLKAFSGTVNDNYVSSTFYLCGVLYDIHSNSEIVISGEKEEESTKEFIEKINSSFLPFTTTFLVEDNKEYKKINDKTTVYVCEENSCKPPINSILDFDKYIH